MTSWAITRSQHPSPPLGCFLDKLAHVQVIINCRYLVAQKCTREDMLAHNIVMPYLDDVMSYNSPTTVYFKTTSFTYCKNVKWDIVLLTAEAVHRTAIQSANIPYFMLWSCPVKGLLVIVFIILVWNHWIKYYYKLNNTICHNDWLFDSIL